MQEATRAVGAGRRRIIERPRLTQMLDESGARIILLVAPAGYGKTTLARQWLSVEGRRATWYHGGPASADVAALAVGLADATAQIVSGAGERMKERLGATDEPEVDAELLAQMLTEDLTEWPSDAWLVIDDYHLAMTSAACEAFTSELSDEKGLQLVITTRRRPSWASARRRTYGELIEIDRTVLCMRDDEAIAVLESTERDIGPLLRRAQGWPAVIGLAAISGDGAVPPDGLSSTLYDYFAEELYQGLDDDLQWALCQLAIGSPVNDTLGEIMFGPKAVELLNDFVGLGIATIDSAGRTELHPLLGDFLDTKIAEFGIDHVLTAVDAMGAYLIEREKWDDAFRLVERFERLGLLVDVITAGLENLLSIGRVATIGRWVDYASDRLLQAPIIDIAEAELAFRQGLTIKAEALALQAARTFPPADPWIAVAHTRAGRAAHMDGRPKDAVNHHSAALAEQPPADVALEAMWGRVVSLVEIEDIEAARAALEQIERQATESVDDRLRLASGRYLLALRGGLPARAHELTDALHLIGRSRDPMARSSFFNSCAAALVQEARYEQAEQIARCQLEEAETYRLPFVVPYGYLRLAGASVGLRKFADAQTCLDQCAAASIHAANPWIDDALCIMRAFTFLSMGQPVDAARAVDSDADLSGPALQGEVLAVRALAFACSGSHKEARAALHLARKMTTTLEVKSLGELVGAVLDPKRAYGAFDFAERHGTADHFVHAYRACPQILAEVVPRNDSRLTRILSQASDAQIARKFGLKVAVNKQEARLSRREQEVLALISQGLTNRAIANALFISESTAKVHVRHIMEKLGARTRTEAAAKGNVLLEARG